jgi:hypothetical protein
MSRKRQTRQRRQKRQTRRGGSTFFHALGAAVVPFGLTALQLRQKRGRSIKSIYS